MQIPFELSGLAVAGIYALVAAGVVAVTWAVSGFVDDWREADFNGGREDE